MVQAFSVPAYMVACPAQCPPHHLCTCPRGYMGTTHWVEALVCTEIDLGLIRGTILEAGYRRHTWYNGRATIQKPPNLDLDPDQV